MASTSARRKLSSKLTILVHSSWGKKRWLTENETNSCSAYVRSAEGEKMQKKLWTETMELFGRHVPPTALEGLL